MSTKQVVIDRMLGLDPHIRYRKSYSRFSELADTLDSISEDTELKAKLMRLTWKQIDDMYGFRTRTKARYAWESIEFIIKERW